MLKKEVVDAVSDGKFHVWAVGHVDEAVELLTGMPAGKRQPDGTWEESTVNYQVNQTLTRLMELARELMKGEEEQKRSSPPPPPASCKG
jgi:predicted ATP-dependent protease